MALGSFEPGLGPAALARSPGVLRRNFAPRMWSRGRDGRTGARGPQLRPAHRPRVPRLGRGALTSAHPAFQRVLAEVDPVHVHMRLAARVHCPDDALGQSGPSGAGHAEPGIPELRRQQQQQQQPEKRHGGPLRCPGPQHGGRHCGGSPCRPLSSAGRQAAPDSVKQRRGPFCLSNLGHVALGPPPQPWGAASHLRNNLPRRPALAWTLQPIRVLPSLITHHPAESGHAIGYCVRKGAWPHLGSGPTTGHEKERAQREGVRLKQRFHAEVAGAAPRPPRNPTSD